MIAANGETLALLQKLRRNHRFYLWTEALFGMVFMSAYRAIRYTVDTESVAEPSCFLSGFVVGVPFVYFHFMLESCWLKTRSFLRVSEKPRLKT